MRKVLQFALFMLVLAGVAQAQVCVPSPIYTIAGIPGVYPNPVVQNTLASGNQGVAYNEVFTLIVPADTTIDLSAIIGIPFPPISVTVNYQEVTAITGLPAGVIYTCAIGSCQVPGGDNSCIKLSGIPTQGGTFPVNMATAYNVAVPGSVPVIGGTNVSVPFPGGLNWDMEITAVGVKDKQDNSFWIAHNSPNPFHGSTRINYNAPKPSAITFEVADLTGKVMYTENMRAVIGANEFTYDASLLAPGIYLYKLSNGEKSATSKMVVQ